MRWGRSAMVSSGRIWPFSFVCRCFRLRRTGSGQKGLSHFSTALYAAVSILPGVAYTALWIQVRMQSAAPAHASWGKQIASVSLYLMAIPAAYCRPIASLALIAVVSVIWLLPPGIDSPSESDVADLRARAVNSTDRRG